MKPTLQKIPGCKDEVAWNMLLGCHKGRLAKILYRELSTI